MTFKPLWTPSRTLRHGPIPISMAPSAAIFKQRYVLSVSFFHGSDDVKTANRSPRAKFPPSIVFPLNSTSAKTFGPTLPPPSLPRNFTPMHAQTLSEKNGSMFNRKPRIPIFDGFMLFHLVKRGINKKSWGCDLYNLFLAMGTKSQQA